MNKSRLFVLVILVGSSYLLYGCGTLANGRAWGQDATLKPGWDKVRASAVRAATSPYTWAPLAGAALLQLEDWDREISDWASDNTPVFSSQRSAEDASDVLKSLSSVAWMITTVATPSGDSSGEWLAAKSKGFAVVVAARMLNSRTTNSIKDWSGRTRPNSSATNSFPSGHSSSASLAATFAAQNLQSINIGDNYRKTLEIGLGIVAAGTAWARVEGNVHFPSDVLAGTALGHFVALFINDAFMGLDESAGGAVDIALTTESVSVGLRWLF